jgi:glutamate-1-semialdehyde 2,1-aminomutase
MIASDLNNAQSLYEIALSLMPGGVNSPVRACRHLKTTPLVVSCAYGSKLIDVDQKTYIDYCISWGALIHGHANDQINLAITDQLQKGTSYGTLCEQEIFLAKELTESIPHLEKVRFVSSGTEATMSAIRLARGFTARKKIIKFSGNYHGHHDSLLKEAGSYLQEKNVPSSLGVPEEAISNTVVLPYNDIKALLEYDALNEVAGIIFEPVCGNMGVVLPKPSFIDALHFVQKKFGILLIVDEVMSGFRNNLLGATFDFNIEGDLFCYGKIIGGGLPCACFGGKRHIMDFIAPEGGVFQAGTLSGNPLAMASGLKVMELLKEDNFYKDLNDKVDFLLNPIDDFIHENKLNVCLNRYGSMFTLFFGVKKVESLEDLKQMDQELFRSYFLELKEKGIFMAPSAFEACFISSKHSFEDLTLTQDAMLGFLKKLL